MTTIARGFAKYFYNFKYEDVPARTLADIKVLLMDYLGVAMRGTRTGSGKIVRGYMLEKGGMGEARMFDSAVKIPAESAAFANAICSHSLEMDDIDRLALFHFSPPVYSAALAMAETLDVSGKELLRALAAGVEIMERLSFAMNPGLRNQGFHTTPTCGIFGGAIACGMMMGLDEEQYVSAMGLAGSQVAGMLEFYGESMQKRFNPGPAAHNAILAAKLAQRGFTGADTIFDGKRGVCRAYCPECDWTKLKDFKQGDYVFEIELKPYACARPIHSTVDAAMDLRRQIAAAGLSVADIDKVDVHRHPWWYEFHTEQHPKTYHDAQMSMCFSVALALVVGGNFFDDYLEAARTRNEAVYQLTQRVFSLNDPEFPNSTGCRAVAFMKDGRRFTAQATYPKGSVENPMTPDERRAKFTRLADYKLQEADIVKLQSIIDNLENHKVSEILAILNA